jgi:hypothetical protein
MRNDMKVPKHFFRPDISSISIAVLLITIVFSMIELIESTNKAFLEVSILTPTILIAIILARVDFFHLQANGQIIYFAS